MGVGIPRNQKAIEVIYSHFEKTADVKIRYNTNRNINEGVSLLAYIFKLLTSNAISFMTFFGSGKKTNNVKIYPQL